MLTFVQSLPVRLRPPNLFRKVQKCTTAKLDTNFSVSPTQSPSEVATSFLRNAALSNNLAQNHIESFLQLSELLIEENAKYNLTAIRKPDDVIRKHIVDALTLLPALDRESPRSLIDVGTGAGFPGLVLAIARPDMQFTLLDSVRKKTAFHDLVIKELGLLNIQSVWARAEDAGQDPRHREQFCVVLARSVAKMRVLAELTLPLARVDGCVVAQKSVDRDQTEIKSAANSFKLCGGVLESVESGWPDEWKDIEGNNGLKDAEGISKAIVVVRKTSPTRQKYPRKPGVPKKTPL